MKPNPPPRFPKAIGPTSLHGAPVRSLPTNGPVSQVDPRRRSHGAPAPRSSYFGRFPERSISPLHRVPAQPIRFSAQFPERIDESAAQAARTSRARFVAPVARNGESRSTCTGCSSSWCPRSTRGFPSVNRWPHCARSGHENSVFARSPARSHHSLCTAAHAGGTRFTWLPTRSVSSARSHLRVERVAVRQSQRMVAHAMRRRER